VGLIETGWSSPTCASDGRREPVIGASGREGIAQVKTRGVSRLWRTSPASDHVGTRTLARSRRRRDNHEHITSRRRAYAGAAGASSSTDPCTGVRAMPTRNRAPFRIKLPANHDRVARLACLRSTAARDGYGSIDGEPWRHPRRAGRRNRAGVEADSGIRTKALLFCDTCGVRSSARYTARTPHAKGNPIFGGGAVLPTTWRGMGAPSCATR
jgi:hypothetical protein